MRLTPLIFLITVHGSLITFPSHAQQWSEFAYISQTLGVNDGRLCLGEASRGELGCPAYAPYVAPSGNIGIGTISPNEQLHVGGSAGGRFFIGESGSSRRGILIAASTMRELSPTQTPYVRIHGFDYGTNRSLSLYLNPYGSNSLVRVGSNGSDTAQPSATLDVLGSLRLGYESSTTLQICDADRTGTIKYQSGDFYYCRNGSAWESLTSLTNSSVTLISGTTTMVSGWPDAILCSGTSGDMLLTLGYVDTTGKAYYDFNIDQNHRIIFDANKAFVSAATGYNFNTSCRNKSISQLYAEGKAFNFIGTSGAGGGALGDRLISGTLAVTANSTTSIISLTTTSTTWGYLGSAGTYLPNLASTILKLSNNPPNPCDGATLGSIKTINGKIFVCRQ